jgi:transcription elongation factor Elf1
MRNEFDGVCPICGNNNVWTSYNYNTGEMYNLNCTKCGFTAGQFNNGWVTLKLKFKERQIKKEYK